MSAAAAALLSARSGPLLRSASAVVTKVSRGFHVFRIDGYSWSTTIPGGQSIKSRFTACGSRWRLQYYPNGADAARPDSGSISVYLRLDDGHDDGWHWYEPSSSVRARYRLSLLDSAGNAAYQLPAATAVFTAPEFEEPVYYYDDYIDDEGNLIDKEVEEPPENPGCGYADFISKDELWRRRETLLKDDSLAVRCDVSILYFDALYGCT